MTFYITVISREMIKPSVPTPNHLKTFKLSHLDQYIPPIPVPILLFFPPQGGTDHLVHQRLKTAFSEILTDFYPLAGTVVDNNSIDCNDNGVEYLEVWVDCRLDHFLESPKSDELNCLLPLEHCSIMSSEAQLEIQVSAFKCGGIAIAARLSHKVADAATLCAFMNTWAAKTREGSRTTPPCFDSATLFPPREVSPFKPPPGSPTQRLISKIFVFPSSKIAALKAKHTDCPTRVEVVTALIWKCLMNATSASRLQSIKSFTVNMVVNLRTRMVPPLPDHSFGNLIIGAMPSSERGAELHCLVTKVREAIRRIDGKSLELDGGVTKFQDSLRNCMELVVRGEMEFYTITSWCRFPFYEADFGWGKPVWASSVNVAHKNVVIFMDTECGEGIEALVTLDEEEMDVFESEEDLLEYCDLK